MQTSRQFLARLNKLATTKSVQGNSIRYRVLVQKVVNGIVIEQEEATCDGSSVKSAANRARACTTFTFQGAEMRVFVNGAKI